MWTKPKFESLTQVASPFRHAFEERFREVMHVVQGEFIAYFTKEIHLGVLGGIKIR